MRLMERLGDACMWVVKWLPLAMCIALVCFLLAVVAVALHGALGFAASIPLAVLCCIVAGALARALQLDRRAAGPQTWRASR
jgi:hypothetical protein